ncbi:MAG: hypothetical protein LLH30_02800 [Candidatus Manganitrophus sp. SA1]|nr:hypothetical protein [Candidatus Manganitrophus morganii]
MNNVIPVWIKIATTLFVIVLVPVYWAHYGPANFLWFSDIALLTAVAALWLESRFLAGTMAVGVLLLELTWNINFFVRLLTGAAPIGLAGYMFDSSKPPYLRGLSLFHLPSDPPRLDGRAPRLRSPRFSRANAAGLDRPTDLLLLHRSL